MAQNKEKSRVSPIPAESSGATPMLIVRKGYEALAFYQRGFGAQVLMKIDQPDGRLGHAELSIGKAKFMLADEFPEISCVGPATLGGTSVSIQIYVEEVDAFVERAVAAGAKLERPIKDEFYGDRVAWLNDPFGHRWSFATHIEDVTPEQMVERAKQHGGPES